MPTATREIDAVVEMALNATYHYKQPLLLDDLQGWYRALFPDVYSVFIELKRAVSVMRVKELYR